MAVAQNPTDYLDDITPGDAARYAMANLPGAENVVLLAHELVRPHHRDDRFWEASLLLAEARVAIHKAKLILAGC